ncbi:MAG: hypothetical protein ACOC1X_01400 [Promethearchaeota archaeon]
MNEKINKWFIRIYCFLLGVISYDLTVTRIELIQPDGFLNLVIAFFFGFFVFWLLYQIGEI